MLWTNSMNGDIKSAKFSLRIDKRLHALHKLSIKKTSNSNLANT